MKKILLWLSLNALVIGTSYAVQTRLPDEVIKELSKAKIPVENFSAVVLDTKNSRLATKLSWQAEVSRQPASVMKVVTTYAGLDILGPNHYWLSPVYLDGNITGNTLNGNLFIQGKGDPFLVVENLWKTFDKLQNLGIKNINGNIVLDQSAFRLPPVDPSAFDGQGLRPYNTRPEALLINFKAVNMSFAPLNTIAKDGKRYASISYDVTLDGVVTQQQIELDEKASCGAWLTKIKPVVEDPTRIAFSGKYPLACGNKNWSLAYSAPNQYAGKIIAGIWKKIGGKFTGQVIYDKVPVYLTPSLYIESQSLAQVIYSINKFSNNVMAQQLFLSLPLYAGQRNEVDYTIASDFITNWWRRKFPQQAAPIIENGSGLSRRERITALGLATLLKEAYLSPYMPELMVSLPSVGIDGTLRSNKSGVRGHLKTGTLNNAVSLAGYVDGQDGKRYVMVAIINHPNATIGRKAFDALMRWTAEQ